MHTAIIVGVVVLCVVVVVNTLLAMKYRRQWKKYQANFIEETVK